MVGEEEFAHLVRVRHAARLEDHEPRFRSPLLSMSRRIIQVSIREEIPTSDCSRLPAARGEAGEQGRDLLHLEEIDEARQHRFYLLLVARCR